MKEHSYGCRGVEEGKKRLGVKTLLVLQQTMSHVQPVTRCAYLERQAFQVRSDNKAELDAADVRELRTGRV